MAQRGRPPKEVSELNKQRTRDLKSLPDFTNFVAMINFSVYMGTFSKEFGEYLIKTVLKKTKI